MLERTLSIFVQNGLWRIRHALAGSQQHWQSINFVDHVHIMSADTTFSTALIIPLGMESNELANHLLIGRFFGGLVQYVIIYHVRWCYDRCSQDHGLEIPQAIVLCQVIRQHEKNNHKHYDRKTSMTHWNICQGLK